MADQLTPAQDELEHPALLAAEPQRPRLPAVYEVRLFPPSPDPSPIRLQARAGHSADCRTAPLTGRRKELVGKGAYGGVYKGIHNATGAVVALKVSSAPSWGEDAECGSDHSPRSGYSTPIANVCPPPLIRR